MRQGSRDGQRVTAAAIARRLRLDEVRPLKDSLARTADWVYNRRGKTAAVRGLAALALQSHRAHGVSPRWLARRLARLRRDGYVLHPYLVSEIAMLGLLDPAVPDETLGDVVSGLRLRPLQLRLSPPPLTAVIDDKALFYTLCGIAGLPVPETYAFLYRRDAGWTRDGATPRTRAEWARALDRLLDGEIVAKPARSDRAEGLRGFRREGAQFFEGDRLVGGAAELYDSIVADRRFTGFVLQRRVRNHETIASLSGGTTLQATRIVTLVEGDEDVAVLYAKLKIVGGGDAVSDNWFPVDGDTQSTTTGSGWAAVDLETGRLGRLRIPRPEGGIDEVDRHPGTGQTCLGLQMPYWEETLELVRRAALRFAMLRTIGWDVAITPDGPLLLEANSGWGPPNGVVPVPPILQRLEEAVRREEEQSAPAGELEDSLLAGVRDASRSGPAARG